MIFTPCAECVAVKKSDRACEATRDRIRFSRSNTVTSQVIKEKSSINFVLVAAPFELGMMSLGLVYLVFLPSIVTTPFGGHIAKRLGTRTTLWISLGVAGLGLMLVVTHDLPIVVLGLALVGIGTFLAQAVATGFISAAAKFDRGVASGLYLASYFLGGLVGSVVLGQLYVRFGWPACVAGTP